MYPVFCPVIYEPLISLCNEVMCIGCGIKTPGLQIDMTNGYDDDSQLYSIGLCCVYSSVKHIDYGHCDPILKSGKTYFGNCYGCNGYKRCYTLFLIENIFRGNFSYQACHDCISLWVNMLWDTVTFRNLIVTNFTDCLNSDVVRLIMDYLGDICIPVVSYKLDDEYSAENIHIVPIEKVWLSREIISCIVCHEKYLGIADISICFPCLDKFFTTDLQYDWCGTKITVIADHCLMCNYLSNLVYVTQSGKMVNQMCRKCIKFLFGKKPLSVILVSPIK